MDIAESTWSMEQMTTEIIRRRLGIDASNQAGIILANLLIAIIIALYCIAFQIGVKMDMHNLFIAWSDLLRWRCWV